MFPSLGMPELILILVIALVVLGPRKLPEVGKALGKTLNEFRRTSMSSFGEITKVKDEIGEEIKQVKNIAKEPLKNNHKSNQV